MPWNFIFFLSFRNDILFWPTKKQKKKKKSHSLYNRRRKKTLIKGWCPLSETFTAFSTILFHKITANEILIRAWFASVHNSTLDHLIHLCMYCTKPPMNKSSFAKWHRTSMYGQQRNSQNGTGNLYSFKIDVESLRLSLQLPKHVQRQIDYEKSFKQL